MVRVDLKHMVDAEDTMHVAVSHVCVGTTYHAACLVKHRMPSHVMQVFVEVWLTQCGVPEIVVGVPRRWIRIHVRTGM